MLTVFFWFSCVRANILEVKTSCACAPACVSALLQQQRSPQREDATLMGFSEPEKTWFFPKKVKNLEFSGRKNLAQTGKNLVVVARNPLIRSAARAPPLPAPPGGGGPCGRGGGPRSGAPRGPQNVSQGGPPEKCRSPADFWL